MPSPVGHALGGLIVALAARGRGPETKAALRAPIPWALFLVCMFLAAVPDIDYVYPEYHRGPTHSIGAALIVALIAAGVTRWMNGRVEWRVTLACGLAYASHVLMDWLGQDPTATPGVKALWPLSDRLFLSGWDVFRSTWKDNPLAPLNFAHNAKTLAQELILLGPIAFWLWWRRTRTSVR